MSFLMNLTPLIEPTLISENLKIMSTPTRQTFLMIIRRSLNQVRIYANKGEAPKCAFALEVATRCLDWYEAYFNINYPLQKCDLIGIPDFTGGAMENWGLITFRAQG